MAASDPSVAPPLRLRRIVPALLVVLAACIGGLVLAVRELGRPAAIPTLPPENAPDATWGAGVRAAPSFALRDENGAAVSLAAYRGRPVIVTFIDPLCRDFCPLEAQRLDDVVRGLPPAARPAILAVSTNVYGNARANLVQDRSKWRLVPQWRWGVGALDRLAAVWRDYQIQVVATAKTVAGVTVHQIAHTEAAYVIDRRGYERALYLWPFRADTVRETLLQLGR